MTTTLEKNVWPLMPKWSEDFASRKTKGCRKACSGNFCHASFEIGWVTGDKKGLVYGFGGLLVTVNINSFFKLVGHN